MTAPSGVTRAGRGVTAFPTHGGASFTNPIELMSKPAVLVTIDPSAASAATLAPPPVTGKRNEHETRGFWGHTRIQLLPSGHARDDERSSPHHTGP